MSLWCQETGTVVLNRKVDQDVYQLIIQSPQIAGLAQPGQFIMLLGWDGEPLLPRAMAPIRFDGIEGSMTIYYRVVGMGTQLMSRLVSGSLVSVVGPLGTPTTLTLGPVALIGRGVGITPLLPIAEDLKSRGIETRVYLSARSAPLLLERSVFEQMGGTVCITDQSHPSHIVTDALRHHLAEGFRPSVAIVSGSNRLSRAANLLALQYGFTLYLFVEEKMACGVGYCKGCAVGPNSSLICTDGPALLAKEVIGS